MGGGILFGIGFPVSWETKGTAPIPTLALMRCSQTVVSPPVGGRNEDALESLSPSFLKFRAWQTGTLDYVAVAET